MTKRHEHKSRICRQVGEDLWGISKVSNKKIKLTKSPGQHGKVHKKNPDTRYEPRYSTQLKEKQKLKKYYGELSEQKFSTLFNTAMKLKGKATQNIFSLLERKLDTVLYRMGFASSIFEARQIVNHGHVKVNNQIVTIPTISIQNGDIISINKDILHIIQDRLNNRNKSIEIPSYLEVDFSSLRGIFLRTPEVEEVPYHKLFDIKAVIEFYSK